MVEAGRGFIVVDGRGEGGGVEWLRRRKGNFFSFFFFFFRWPGLVYFATELGIVRIQSNAGRYVQTRCRRGADGRVGVLSDTSDWWTGGGVAVADNQSIYPHLGGPVRGAGDGGGGARFSHSKSSRFTWGGKSTREMTRRESYARSLSIDGYLGTYKRTDACWGASVFFSVKIGTECQQREERGLVGLVEGVAYNTPIPYMYPASSKVSPRGEVNLISLKGRSLAAAGAKVLRFLIPRTLIPQNSKIQIQGSSLWK